MPYQFLSTEWVDAVRQVRERHAADAPRVAVPVRMNVVVTDAPVGDGTVRAYMDTTAGSLLLELGELDGSDLTVTTDYETARALFLDQDPQAVMQAFMGGRMKVQGDMMKLLALQTSLPADGTAKGIAREVKDLTEG